VGHCASRLLPETIETYGMDSPAAALSRRPHEGAIMNICMTLLVRNEEDILRQNIEFHLDQGVDFIIGTDNLSDDGTTDILREYERLGCLHYLYEGSDDYSQDLWVTRMAKMAQSRFAPNWIIHCDADEFWWPTESRNLVDAFAHVPSETMAIRVRRSNFLPVRNVVADCAITEMVIREAKSLNANNEPLPDKVAHRPLPDVEVHQGNHGVDAGGTRVSSPLFNELLIFHYPIRTYRQLERKVVLGGAAYGRNQRLPSNVGSTWRYLFRLHQEGRLGDWFDEQILDEESVGAGLERGSLIRDLRLREYLLGLGEGHRTTRSIEATRSPPGQRTKGGLR
jgi:hypothetical protein